VQTQLLANIIFSACIYLLIATSFTIIYYPTSFTVSESIFILSIVIIGGMRNFWGIILSAAFLILLPEALRFIGLPNNVAANLRQIIYGGILVLMMFRYSRGFIAHQKI